jgi:hypothetical protein
VSHCGMILSAKNACGAKSGQSAILSWQGLMIPLHKTKWPHSTTPVALELYSEILICGTLIL